MAGKCACFPQGKHGTDYMQKSETAWKTAARMAALGEEADDDFEREHPPPLVFLTPSPWHDEQ
jgi:hypothetical protein